MLSSGIRFGFSLPRTAEFAHVRIGFLDGLLVDLLLRRESLVAQEIDRQVEELLLLAIGQHVLHGADDALRLQVAAAHAEGSRVKRRRVRDVAVDVAAPGTAALSASRPFSRHLLTVARISRISGRSPASGWSSRSSTVTPLRPFSTFRQQVRRERAEHRHVDHADLELSRLAKVVDDRFCARDQAALADDQVVRVVGAVAHDRRVAPPGQRRILRMPGR